ncbi:hypothetical protein J3U03_07075 [Bifidobacterium sp. B4114]|uniref:hypothetical protein n=2 Tax=unclassified Bifidobacterium TaxID=2608897 RepID=UPI00226B1A45|nr:hypothetical protein [Bifidobacterium sp. B4114]MCX8658780.1 hypothetical protein [Bifidobacterium sp. B4114]
MSDSNIPSAPTRRGDPETSFEAAEKVDVNRMQEETIRALAGLSYPVEEWRLQELVEKRLGCRLGDSTIRTRLSELVKKGLVELVDREGRSRTGHRCSRYRLAEVGVAA